MVVFHNKQLTSTYRFQLNSDFQFCDLTKKLKYIKDLKISHIYLSPIFQSTPGSTHGYDVVDYNLISTDLGGEDALKELYKATKELELGIILDFVPNHMATSQHNSWWIEALKGGPKSKYFNFFDIRLKNHEDKISLPILGEDIEEAIQQKKFSLSLDQYTDSCFVNYYDNKFPLNDNSLEFLRVNFMLSQASLKEFANDPVFMRKLLDLQYYRLDFWKHGSEQINYRRFFNINSLIGMNMDSEEVFQESHELLFKLIAENKIDGVRIDHPDGLSNPRRYYERFQNQVKSIKKNQSENKPFYLLVEKILSHKEELRDDWLVHGTTGYEFGCYLNKIFVNPVGFNKLQRFYKEFSSQDQSVVQSIEDLIKQYKSQALNELFKAEFNYLLGQLNSILKNQSKKLLEQAFEELLINFPVYRTYFEENQTTNKIDEEIINYSINECKSKMKDSFPELISVLDELKEIFIQKGDYKNPQTAKFIREFQQLTCSVLAKGVEDTFHYRFYPLASLNEVGCEPVLGSDSLEEFHKNNKLIQQSWPLCMLNTSTHDSKRSEDVRARINALSGIAEQWIVSVDRWSKLNQDAKTKSNFSDFNVEYLLYQTLIGTLEEKSLNKQNIAQYKAKISECLIKSVREAKDKTKWEAQNKKYEDELLNFIDLSFLNTNFLQDLGDFTKQIDFYGKIYSISQLILKLTSPGVPDIYQGNELFQYCLVDPDNRRQINYDIREKLLDEVSKNFSMSCETFSEFDSRCKLFFTQRLLEFRQQNPDLFLSASYKKINLSGKLSEHFLAFSRSYKNAKYSAQCIVVVPTQLSANGSNLFNLSPKISLPDKVWNDSYIEVNESLELKNIFTDQILKAEKRSSKNAIKLKDMFSIKSNEQSNNLSFSLPFAVLSTN